MVNELIRWSLRNRAAVIACTLILTAVGGSTVLRMPVDVFPDLTAPTVTVLTEAYGMAPAEVESQVTFPIEAALNGAPSVRRVRSSTSAGFSIVWVEFEWGADLHVARQVVGERLALVASALPPQASTPVLAPNASIMGEIMFLALTSDRHSPLELRATVDSLIRRRLLSVPGVAQVTLNGGDVKQYQVRLSPDRLQAYGCSLQEVLDALSRSNQNAAAGVLNQRGSQYLVTGAGRIRSLRDIEDTVVRAEDGVPLLIRDLGDVLIGAAPRTGTASANGLPAVVLGVQKQSGANTLTLTRALDRVLDDIESKLPAGMAIHRSLFRQADFIETAVRNVEHALRDGAILVIAILFVFLANFRATFITLTAIPLSLLVAVLVLHALDASINTMTLGGFAIAIGALVDDAVIDVENVFRRLRENAALPPERRRNTLSIVYDASVEIRSSIVFATLIIALVFLPLFFLAGVEGRLLRPLGAAYIVSLFASLLIALTVTPVLCHLLLPSGRAVRRQHEPWLVRVLKSVYGAVLNPVLNHPWLVVAPTLTLLLAALLAATQLGRSFLPEFNEGSLTIQAVTLPGTSLEESSRLAQIVEETLLKHPEVTAIARRTGRGELDEHSLNAETSEFEVSLSMQRRGKAAFLAALRRDLAGIPGVNVIIGQPISHRIDHMLSGSRANIAVKIFGPDLHELRKLAQEVSHAMEAVSGVVDLSAEQQMDVPILEVRFDRPAMARHGLSIQDVVHALEACTQGVPVTRVLEGQQSFDLVVRTAALNEYTPDTLGDMMVDTPAGARVPLKALARVVKTTGPNSISREQVERKIVVQCNVAGRDVISVVREAEKAVQAIIADHPGYRVEFGGQFESAQQAGKLLALLGLVVIAGIGFLLHVAFGSGRDALLVMVNLPLALIGGVAGVYVSGGILSVASIIGFIAVFGIATRNGIMMVSHICHLQAEEGVADFRQAVYQGAMERLAPILMTALASGLALVPLAFAGEQPGSEIQTPMAIVILFGLTSSMLLNMLIVPALYLRFGRPVKTENGGLT